MTKKEYFLYKLRRECGRVAMHIKGWGMHLYEPYLRWQHAKNWSSNISVTIGDIAIRNQKIALLLIYQPNNLSNSTLWTCQHLIKSGYAPLIVSNTPLQPSQLQLLKSHAWRILCRPNVGYDFGGYQDGIRFLNLQNLDLDALIVMNDSIWFPLYEGDTTIQRMEDSPEDFLGLQAHKRPSHRLLKCKKPKKQYFLESYFWLFKRRALCSDAFKQYWHNYKASSSKYHTVRNGEHSITPYLAANSLSYRGLITMDGVVDWLAHLPNDALYLALDQTSSCDPEYKFALDQLLTDYSDTSRWRSNAFDFIARLTSKKSLLATVQTLTISQLDVGYLKKGGDAMRLHALSFFASKVNEGNHVRKPHPSIWEEMQAKIAHLPSS
jgi:hypothetical protein